MRSAMLLIVLLLAAGCGRRENPPAGDRAAAGADPAAKAEDVATASSPADEAAALDRGPRALETLALVAPLAATGQMLFDAKGCTGCHKLGEGGDAPDLRGVAERRTAAWLRRQITDPEWMAEHDPLTRAMVTQYGTPMTDLEVTGDEATALLQFLLRESGGR